MVPGAVLNSVDRVITANFDEVDWEHLTVWLETENYLNS